MMVASPAHGYGKRDRVRRTEKRKDATAMQMRDGSCDGSSLAAVQLESEMKLVGAHAAL